MQINPRRLKQLHCKVSVCGCYKYALKYWHLWVLIDFYISWSWWLKFSSITNYLLSVYLIHGKFLILDQHMWTWVIRDPFIGCLYFSQIWSSFWSMWRSVILIKSTKWQYEASIQTSTSMKLVVSLCLDCVITNILMLYPDLFGTFFFVISIRFLFISSSSTLNTSSSCYGNWMCRIIWMLILCLLVDHFVKHCVNGVS